MPTCDQLNPGTLSQICSQVSPAHPFYPHIQKFRAQIDPLLGRNLALLECRPNERMLTRTLLRANPGEPLTLKWVYYSAQFWTENTFRSCTFLYKAERGKTSLYEFPEDPKLKAPAQYLQPFLRKDRSNSFLEGVQLLRYVPRRRLTFRSLENDSAQGTRLIGKFVRTGEADPLCRKLTTIEDRVSGADLQIARVTEVRSDHDLFFQSHLPGTELGELLSGETYYSLLKSAGSLHARVHSLPVIAETSWNIAQFVEAVRKDISWISLFHPDQRSFLEQTAAKWLDAIPDFNPEEFVFCHGDFRPPHLLANQTDPWGVIDFDGYLMADPTWEMALFLTSLKRDVPFFSQIIADPSVDWCPVFERAEQGYLQGYFHQCATGFSYSRLTWFRLAMEIHYLARSLQRDLVDPVAFGRTWGYIQTLADELE